MVTRNVVLTDHQAALIEKLVSSGRYQNASEVLREGLRMIESREAEEKSKLKALREAVNVGLEDIKAGRFIDFDSTKELGDYLDKLGEEAIAGAKSKRKARK